MDSGEFFSDAPVQLYPGRFLDEAGGLTGGFLGADEFRFDLTGGGTNTRVTRAPGRALELSMNPRAASALDAFAGIDPSGGLAVYRDSADAAAFLNEQGLKFEIEKLKTAIGRSALKVPTPEQLGVFRGISDGPSGLVTGYDLGEVFNAYRDATRLVSLHQQGVIDLDFQSYRIKTIGTSKLTPEQFSAEIESRYSKAFTAAVELGNQRYKDGKLPFPVDMPEQLQVGLFADDLAKGTVLAVLRYAQSIGVPEGPGQPLRCHNGQGGHCEWRASLSTCAAGEVTMRKKSVRDVESTLSYLLGVLSSVERGDMQEFDNGAYDYTRKVLAAAEQSVRKLGMYEAAEHAINESERLILAGQFEGRTNCCWVRLAK